MQALRLSPVTATLSVGDLLLDAAVEAAFLAALPIACDRDVLKAQVDSDLLLSGDTLFDRYGHGQAQPPVSPSASCARQPCRHLTLSRRSGSNTRKVLPQKRTAFPLRLILAALNGTQPKERRGPRLTRQRSRIRLAVLRFMAYSQATRWIVSAPIFSKYSEAPEESAQRSNPLSHLRFPVHGRADFSLTSAPQFQTVLTSMAATLSQA